MLTNGNSELLLAAWDECDMDALISIEIAKWKLKQIQTEEVEWVGNENPALPYLTIPT